MIVLSFHSNKDISTRSKSLNTHAHAHTSAPDEHASVMLNHILVFFVEFHNHHTMMLSEYEAAQADDKRVILHILQKLFFETITVTYPS